MTYEVVRDNLCPDAWRVEGIDHEDEGRCYSSIFFEPRAKERAEEYAAWKNAR